MTNPALTLHRILTEIIDHNSESNLQDVLYNVFNIENRNSSQLILCLNNLKILLNETELLVEQQERLNNTKNKTFLQRINLALNSFDFTQKLQYWKRNLSAETITALSYIGEYISFTYDIEETHIDGSTIAELQQDVEELITSISESDLPSEAKLLLINNLYAIKVALHHYTIFGDTELKNTLEKTIGSVFVNNATLTEVSDNQNVSRFFGIIDKLNSVLDLGTSITDTVLPFVKDLMKITQ